MASLVLSEGKTFNRIVLSFDSGCFDTKSIHYLIISDCTLYTGCIKGKMASITFLI